jgi:hypothetical protein
LDHLGLSNLLHHGLDAWVWVDADPHLRPSLAARRIVALAVRILHPALSARLDLALPRRASIADTG